MRADLAQIDLIVLDLRLPHAGGVELVRSIRKLDGGRLPILVFSGTIATAEEVRDLAALGVAGYVNEYSAVQHILPSLAPHLFPDNFNRRGSPRVVLGIPVAYRFGNTIAAALTLNLSKGGLAIRTMSPLAGRLEAARPLPAARLEARHRSRIARSPGAIAASAWACSSKRSIRPIRPRSTSSSTSISSRTEKRDERVRTRQCCRGSRATPGRLDTIFAVSLVSDVGRNRPDIYTLPGAPVNGRIPARAGSASECTDL